MNKGNIEKASKGIESLEKTNMQLNEMLQSLQEWAPSETTETHFEQMDISECIDRVIPICEEVALLKNIKIDKQVSSKEISLDSNMMESIVRNLINNAIKFSPENSTINVTGVVENGCYLVRISDQGEGMESETVAKILSGEKVDSTKGTNGENGTGLGLQLVMNFLKLHQATWDIQSERGREANLSSAFLFKLSVFANGFNRTGIQGVETIF